MLTNIIPPKFRQPVYAVLALAGVVLSSIQVAYKAANVHDPMWLAIGFAVFGYVSFAVHGMAASNVRELRKHKRASVQIPADTPVPAPTPPQQTPTSQVETAPTKNEAGHTRYDPLYVLLVVAVIIVIVWLVVSVF